VEQGDIIPGVEVDWNEGQAVTGCSDKQTRFVQALMKGANKTQAAREAGYAGEGSTLRSSASQLAKSHKVKALFAWAKAGGAGLTDVPGDVGELKKILWRHARGADKNASLRATEVIYKLEAQEREDAAQHVGSSADTLAEIAKLSPELAKTLALDAIG
jgi:phage terminase small subunit